MRDIEYGLSCNTRWPYSTDGKRYEPQQTPAPYNHPAAAAAAFGPGLLSDSSAPTAPLSSVGPFGEPHTQSPFGMNTTITRISWDDYVAKFRYGLT